MEVRVCNSSTQEIEAESSGIQDILLYRWRSRLAWATWQDPVSIHQKEVSQKSCLQLLIIFCTYGHTAAFRYPSMAKCFFEV